MKTLLQDITSPFQSKYFILNIIRYIENEIKYTSNVLTLNFLRMNKKI
jgi:hypothetical protein